jgi:16S rRNA (cytidine1402-2'-O)-methyltransferase
VAEQGSGRLLVVGTPIGNLGDLSPRAAAALSGADLVVAEDTRRASRLLAHLEVRVATVSFHEHNAAARLPELLARLAAGARVALTTDAGMPGISDPGAALVAAARAAGHAVEVVPGPSAVTAAVALSGQDAAGFVFGGFLPPRPAGARRGALERLLAAAGANELPLVLYEAPHRIRSLLRDLQRAAGDSEVAVCRELTKLHEEVLAGTPAAAAERLVEERGEFTIVISPRGHDRRRDAGSLDVAALAHAAAGQGLAPRSVVELLRAAGVPRRRAYEVVSAAADKGRLSAR